MNEIKYEIIRRIAVIKKRKRRLGNGAERDQLERSRTEVRHPALERRPHQNGKGRHAHTAGSYEPAAGITGGITMKIEKIMAAPGMTVKENKINFADVTIRVVGEQPDLTLSLEADGRAILVPFAYVQTIVEETKTEMMMRYALRTGGKR